MLYDYDDITAFHYAAFRPQLHHKILRQCLASEELFASGLDIGSGTGQSSLALANFCDSVIGIEPSKEMLSKVITHPKVTYHFFDKYNIDSQNDTFDIITLAGSLWYAKSQQLLDEICRVGKPHAILLPYDFEICVTDVLKTLSHTAISENKSGYNHEENFSGLRTNQINCLGMIKEKTSFDISIENLAHLVLSDKDQYYLVSEHLGKEKLFSKVVQKLRDWIKSEKYSVRANLFATKYILSK